jgi:hypothetical protein
VEEYGFGASRYYVAFDMSLHQTIPWGTALFQTLKVTHRVKNFSPSVQSECSLPFSKGLDFAVKDYRTYSCTEIKSKKKNIGA